MNSLRFFSHFCASTNCYKLSEHVYLAHQIMPVAPQLTVVPAPPFNQAVLPENLNLLKFLTFSPFARILHDYGFAVL